MLATALLAYLCIGLGANLAPALLHMRRVRGAEDTTIALAVIAWAIVTWPVGIRNHIR